MKDINIYRTQGRKKCKNRQTVLVVLLVIALLFLVDAAKVIAKPNPGHNATQIGGGTFNSSFGVFTFPQNLTVTNNISAAYYCLDGDCRNTWPSTSITDCTDVNGCTIIAEDTSCANDYLLDGNGDCFATDASGECGSGNVCAGGHTHNYDNYGSWDLFTNGVSRDSITTSETVGFDGNTGVDLGVHSNGVNISYNCTEIVGTDLGCDSSKGPAVIYVSTDFEEETHCSEHDGTCLSCSGETLNVDTVCQGEDARCSGTQVYLDGEGNCDSGYLDADGVDAVNDAIAQCSDVTANENDPQVTSMVASNFCLANSTGTGIVCSTSLSVLSCSDCDSSFIKAAGESPGAATSDFDIDDGTFYIDRTNNNVGFGSTVPSSKLKVGIGGGDSTVIIDLTGIGETWARMADSTNKYGLGAHGDSYSLMGFGGTYGVYGKATSTGTYQTGIYSQGWVNDAASSIYSSTGSIADIIANKSDGRAIYAHEGDIIVEYGGICVDDTTNCASDSAGDGDLYIYSGSICVSSGNCTDNPSADGELVADRRIRSGIEAIDSNITFGGNADTVIRYSDSWDRYFFWDDYSDANYSDITVGSCTGCDIAEKASADSDEVLESGDILVVAVSSGFDVTKSSEPFSNKVIGVFSSTPGVYMSEGDDGSNSEYELCDTDSSSNHAACGKPPSKGIVLGGNYDFRSLEGLEHKGAIPLALAGRVPAKVCLENGIISKGDYITTSSFPGHGMRWSLLDISAADGLEEVKALASENELRRGSIVGKALEVFDGMNSTYNNHLGQPCGLVEILVALQ